MAEAEAQTATAVLEKPSVPAVRDLIIIGSGPAGLTAAIYAARANLQPLVIEGFGAPPDPNVPGGQLMLTTEVENFPGFPEGVMGPDLMTNFRKQAERFGTEFITEMATRVDFSKRPFTVWIGEKQYQSRSVIVATGAKSKMIGLEAENRLLGHGLSTCATCDGFFFTGKNVVIVGGGDSAMEEALFLTRFASSVTIIHRRHEFRASKIMQDRVLGSPKIKVLWNTVVTDLVGEEKLEAVKLKQTETGDESTLPIDGVFVAIGHLPNTSLFKGQLNMNETGYLITDGVKTNIEGVFAAGDVADHIYRQAITAAGTGCAASIEAERWLERNE